MGFPLSDLGHLRVALECARDAYVEPRQGRLGVGVTRKHLRSLRLAEAVGPTTPSSPLTSSRGGGRTPPRPHLRSLRLVVLTARSSGSVQIVRFM